MKTFNVIRMEDVSGISGTGIVAEGVEFHDGQVAISWFGQYHILEVSEDIKTWIAVHSHNGKTQIKYLKEPQCQKNNSIDCSHFLIKFFQIRKPWKRILEFSQRRLTRWIRHMGTVLV